jgi:hypothetical protein
VRGVADVGVVETGYSETREQTQEKHNDAVTGQAQIDGRLHESILSVFALIEQLFSAIHRVVFDEPWTKHDQQGFLCDERLPKVN